jgi:hypothetical protein
MNQAIEDFSKYDDFLEQYDMYIWDFDYTILKIHSYASNIELKDVESASWKKIIGDFADPIFFRDLVYYIISKKKEVAVVSFGTYNVIKAYLDRLFDDTRIFDSHNILTPLIGNKRYSSSFRVNSDKNEHLVCLMRQNPSIKYDRTIFFDDTYQNIQGARELGLKGVLINPKICFTKPVWDELVKTETITIDKTTNKNEQKDHCNILGSEDDLEPREPKKRNSKKDNVKKIACHDDYLIETFGGAEKKEKDTEESVGIPISSYFMNWINIFAVIFILAYYLIKKYTGPNE